MRFNNAKIKLSIRFSILSVIALLGIFSSTAYSLKQDVNTIYSPDIKRVNIDRISGLDRYSTSAEISNCAGQKFDRVFLASGNNFADALYAGPLASTFGSPVVLTHKDYVSKDILDLLELKEVKEVTLIGGTNSISVAVEKSIRNKGYTVNRIAGNDRFDTAVKVNDEIYKARPNKRYSYLKVAFSNGNIFADSLVASPYIYYRGLNDYLYFLPYKKGYEEGMRIIFGGYDSVENTGNEDGITRFNGVDRYDTAVQIAKDTKNYIPGGKINTIFIASGENYADALSAGPVATYHITNGIILLTNKNRLNENTKKFIEDNKEDIYDVYIVGGEGSIANIENEIKSIFENNLK